MNECKNSGCTCMYVRKSRYKKKMIVCIVNVLHLHILIGFIVVSKRKTNKRDKC